MVRAGDVRVLPHRSREACESWLPLFRQPRICGSLGQQSASGMERTDLATSSLERRYGLGTVEGTWGPAMVRCDRWGGGIRGVYESIGVYVAA